MNDAYERLSDPWAMTVFVATLFLPVLVGVLSLRRTRTQSDFFVGGRSMGRVIVALSAVSSGRSSWLVLGVSGMAFTRGVGAIWAVLGYTLVELVMFLTIGRRLRVDAQRYDAVTLLDWFESRFSDSARRLRLAGGVIMGLFLIAYVAAQLNGGAKTIEASLGVPFVFGLALAALMIVVYMMLGGYVAVAYNDAVRAAIMLLGLVVLPVWATISMGGLAPVVESLRRVDDTLLDPLALGLGVMIGFLGIGLGSPGQPHILVRFMSIDDEKNIPAAGLIGLCANLIMGAGAVAVGLVGRARFTSADALPESDPEMVYLALSSGTFSAPVFGLLVGGIFAAILSTADSQLLVVASTVVKDLWEGVLRPGATPDEATRLRQARVVVCLAGLFAVLFAWWGQGLVFWLVLFAWGGLGASFGPALILGLYWKRTTWQGALAGMLVGTFVTGVWKVYLKPVWGVYELIPGFTAAMLAVIVTSVMTNRGRSSTRGERR